MSYVDIRSELMKLATKCSRVKGDTARKKAEDFYYELVDNFIQIQRLKEYKNIEKAYYIIKSKKITFYDSNKNVEIIPITSIAKYSYDDNNIFATDVTGKIYTFNRTNWQHLIFVLETI